MPGSSATYCHMAKFGLKVCLEAILGHGKVRRMETSAVTVPRGTFICPAPIRIHLSGHDMTGRAPPMIYRTAIILDISETYI